MWGGCGLLAALLFCLVKGAVDLALSVNFLPGGGFNPRGGFFIVFFTSFLFIEPFFTSVFVNLSFIHPFMVLRRLVIAAVELRLFDGSYLDFNQAAVTADWAGFISDEIFNFLFFRMLLMTLIFILPVGL